MNEMSVKALECVDAMERKKNINRSAAGVIDCRAHMCVCVCTYKCDDTDVDKRDCDRSRKESER